jgi:glycosyltransferase involved in cell wall biosynthesis
VYIQNNISLKTFWPALFCRRPIVLIHQTWISRVDGRIAWQDRLKLRAVRSAVKNIAVSAALADSIPARCEVVPNPYRHEIFRVFSPNRRDRALIFVGRLVSDKGCSLLLKALVELGKLGMFPTLTIVGTGPEESNLRGQVEKEGLRAKVDFVGRKSGGELANILNCHRVLVVPSLWQEPFGIVALEGIACGCVVVGSSGGGLSGAIGRCGITFENGDVKGLVAALMKVLEDSEYCASFGEQRAEHLRHHRADVVGRRYIDIFNSVIPNG